MNIDAAYAEFQQKQTKKFNKLLLDNRKNGRLEEYVIDICKSLHILTWVKMKDYRIDNDFNAAIYENSRNIIKLVGRKTADEIMRTGVYNGNKQEVHSIINSVNITKSYYKRLIVTFEVNFKGETRDVEMHLILPKLINTHFIVNNNKLYPIYQIVESSCYTSKKDGALVHKTHISPIKLTSKDSEIVDIEGITHEARSFGVKISKDLNPLLYYLANAGMTETLKYLHLHDVVRFTSTLDDVDSESETVFKINGSLNVVCKSHFLDDDFTKSVIHMIIDACNSRNNIENIEDTVMWRKRLGAVFTKTASLQESKGNDVLSTFERVLDVITIANLRLPNEAKNTTYAILRWMMTNYDTLRDRDNMDLRYKRIRLSEAIVATFAKKLSESIYSLLSKKNKKLSIDNIVNCLRVDPMIMMYNIIKTSRYDNNVNDMSIWNYLKYTFKGENSFSKISDDFRRIHPSHLGKFDINSSSSNDPGLTGTFCPMSNIKDQYFYDLEEDNDYIDYNMALRDQENLESAHKYLNSIGNVFLSECIEIANSSSSRIVEPLVTVNKMKYKKYKVMVDNKLVRVINFNNSKNHVKVI